jgi:hypothetical protein
VIKIKQLKMKQNTTCKVILNKEKCLLLYKKKGEKEVKRGPVWRAGTCEGEKV